MLSFDSTSLGMTTENLRVLFVTVWQLNDYNLLMFTIVINDVYQCLYQFKQNNYDLLLQTKVASALQQFKPEIYLIPAVTS